MESVKVIAVTVTCGGPTSFTLLKSKPTDQEKVLSYSIPVQTCLVSALLADADVKVDLVRGSNVVKRVNPFTNDNNNPSPPIGKYQVSRVATQRMANGNDEHLEAFLKKEGDENDKAYNVYDLLAQQLLQAAFAANRQFPAGVGLDVEFDVDPDIVVTITLVKPGPR